MAHSVDAAIAQRVSDAVLRPIIESVLPDSEEQEGEDGEGEEDGEKVKDVFGLLADDKKNARALLKRVFELASAK